MSQEGAQKILTDSVWVKALSTTGLETLPVKIYEAQYTARRPSVLAWLIVDEMGRCHLMGGDLDRILGLQMDWEARIAFALTVYNATLDREPKSQLQSPDRKVGYLFAVLSAVDPEARLTLLHGTKDIDGPAGNDDAKVQNLARSIAKEIRPPQLSEGQGADRVTFYTWENPGGQVVRNETLLWPDGRVALRRHILGTRIGNYEAYRARY